MFTCHHCIKVFNNSQDLENHKQRKTSCLSWIQVESKLNYYVKQLDIERKKARDIEANQMKMVQEIQSYESQVIKLLSNIQKLKTLNTQQDVKIKLRDQQLLSLRDLTDRNEELLQEKDRMIKKKDAELLRLLTPKTDDAQIILGRYMELVQSNTSFWNDIKIEATHISKKTRASIKKLIYHIPCKKKIVELIESTHPSILVSELNVDTSCFALHVSLTKKDVDMCCICFERHVSKEIICQTCSQSNICKQCEMTQMQTYNRCAFCNTNYE